jgi:hypothetical protein
MWNHVLSWREYGEYQTPNAVKGCVIEFINFPIALQVIFGDRVALQTILSKCALGGLIGLMHFLLLAHLLV